MRRRHYATVDAGGRCLDMMVATTASPDNGNVH
jgi:hypothetical protein